MQVGDGGREGRHHHSAHSVCNAWKIGLTSPWCFLTIIFN